MSVTANVRPVRPMRPAELLYERAAYCVSTELEFDNDADAHDLLCYLRAQRVTGTLHFDLSQGGVNRVRFVQQERIVQK